MGVDRANFNHHSLLSESDSNGLVVKIAGWAGQGVLGAAGGSYIGPQSRLKGFIVSLKLHL